MWAGADAWPSSLYGPYNRRMAVAVQDIVAIPGMPLRLLAGEEDIDRPIRWVHVSELEDPPRRGSRAAS